MKQASRFGPAGLVMLGGGVSRRGGADSPPPEVFGRCSVMARCHSGPPRKEDTFFARDLAGKEGRKKEVPSWSPRSPDTGRIFYRGGTVYGPQVSLVTVSRVLQQPRRGSQEVVLR